MFVEYRVKNVNLGTTCCNTGSVPPSQTIPIPGQPGGASS